MNNIRLLPTALFVSVLLFAANSHAVLYTLKANVNLRSGPGTNHSVLGVVDHSRTLARLSEKGNWTKVRTVSGAEGFIRSDLLSDTVIRVRKEERRVSVIRGGRTVKSWSAAFCPFNPTGDKVRQGDGGTPEGRFFVCETIRNPKKAKYGARSIRLSYPNIEDARHGLKDGLIGYKTYLGIVKKIRAGRMPNQGTKLGGSIRLHGGGGGEDWTLGCVALDDRDVIELYEHVRIGTRVEVYKSEEQEKRIGAPGFLNAAVLEGARKQLKNPALYTQSACGIIKLDYPGGDIRQDHAVCTDIIVRAFREAGLFPQAMIHEDAVLHPSRYKKWIKKPNYHIDHRRTRNLNNFFAQYAKILPNDVAANPKTFRPGDIVLMDTGIRNGTVYDHIGILGKTRDEQGFPNVINIWTVGFRTASMDLLGNGYPDVVGHFRLAHPFDYY